MPSLRWRRSCSAAPVLAIAEQTFGDRLDPAARFFVEQVFDEPKSANS